eukprot:12506265-Alexandrium_andersonii.AAC.1
MVCDKQRFLLACALAQYGWGLGISGRRPTASAARHFEATARRAILGPNQVATAGSPDLLALSWGALVGRLREC